MTAPVSSQAGLASFRGGIPIGVPARTECPTCGASGDEPCIRGRKPSPIWKRGELMPHPHDSRIAAQRKDTQ